MGTHLVSLVKRLFSRPHHRPIKSFEHELEAAGGVAGRFDAGYKIVPTAKVIGSVSRWREL